MHPLPWQCFQTLGMACFFEKEISFDLLKAIFRKDETKLLKHIMEIKLEFYYEKSKNEKKEGPQTLLMLPHTLRMFHILLYQPQSFAKPLEVHHFPLP